MKSEFEEKLAHDFPFMRREKVKADQQERAGEGSSADAVYCDIGDGWYELLYDLCSEITKAYQEAGQPVDIEIVQVKEKYGALRFYYEFKVVESLDFCLSDDEARKQLFSDICAVHQSVDRIVAASETRSEQICERCGAPGLTRIDLAYVLTLCSACYESVAAK